MSRDRVVIRTLHSITWSDAIIPALQGRIGSLMGDRGERTPAFTWRIELTLDELRLIEHALARLSTGSAYASDEQWHICKRGQRWAREPT